MNENGISFIEIILIIAIVSIFAFGFIPQFF
jgi:competence protein ComGC